MEWVLVVLGAVVVLMASIWLLRRRSVRRSDRYVLAGETMHTGSRATKGVSDSMNMRLPTGGNSGG